MRGLKVVGVTLSITLCAWISVGIHAAQPPGRSMGHRYQVAAAPPHDAHAASGRGGVSPAMARERLIAGNRRFVAEQPISLRRDLKRLMKVAQGQRPFAVIVGCSDSRVPVEIVFDQGLGDLFVIRLAGNIVDDAGLGSIEYAVDHLGARLVVVLGHDRCGAVEATLKGESLPGHMVSLAEAILPAVNEVRGRPGDPLQNAVTANVKQTVELLRESEPLLAGWVKSGRLKVVGARYELDTGKVVWLP
jgi:carbonic anhydrase